MELTQLHYFKTVAQTGKISRAAELLFISAPALSASMARLEKELGTRLFDRTNNRITLNRQGEIFLRYVQQVFSSLECARAELRQSTLLQQQTVGVATLWSTLWMELITRFYQAYPEVTLSSAVLRPAQLEPQGLLSQYTFILAETEELPLRLTQEMERLELFRDGLAVLTRADHPLARDGYVTPEGLTQENLLLPVTGTAFRSRIDRLFVSKGIPAPQGTETPFAVNNHMAEQGVGICFTTTATAPSTPPGLRCLPVKGMEDVWTMSLYWWKNRELTPREQTFLAFVRQYYKK